MLMTSAPKSDLKPDSAHFQPYRGQIWRIVEAQHRISTNRLAGSMDDQHVLENLAEETKPTLPKAVRHLHYLLASPFRYGHKQASRFRRLAERPGIFYASESLATALSEIAYWRLYFFARSPGMVLPIATMEHSALSVGIETDRAFDLTKSPYVVAAAHWMHPHEYTACQRFAAAARLTGGEIIRYVSVRDPEKGINIAVLDPKVFADTAPVIQQTWHLRFEYGVLNAIAAFPSNERYRFYFEQFGLTAPHSVVKTSL